MLPRWTLLLFFGLHLNTDVKAQNPDQYLGIPLGGVHLSQDSTAGELYAYDEYSILINHFEHHPKKTGCTSMMVGPPRLSDTGDTLVEGHGVLVGLAHPLVQAPNSDFSLSQRRSKRQNRIFGGNLYKWPIVMDHLLMGPEQMKDPPSAAVPQARTFTGIHIRNLSNASEGRNITIKANMTVEHQSTTAPELTTIVQETTMVQETTSTQTPSTTEVPITESTTQQSTTQTESTTTQQFTTTESTTAQTTSTTSSVPRSSRKGLVVTASVRSKTVSPRLQKLSLSSQSTAKPVIVPQENQKTNGYIEQVDVNDVFMTDNYNSQEGNEFERTDRGSYKLDVHYSDLDFIRKMNGDDVDFPRRAPSRNSAIQVFNSGDKLNNGQQRRVEKPDSKQTTPLFYVVEDPHRGHRERILQQLIESERSTTTTTPLPIKPLDPRFTLPESSEQLGIFLLSNGAKLTDYRWFGIYNHCEKKHVELAVLRGVDPPREERIMPISGWSHNVSSYRVQLLNCNTLLVPGFNFDPDENTRGSTYFVAGIGQFPDNIEKQVKAIVVGERQNAPLRRYQNEDVLLRLPRSYRTFDIDFLSVFNTHEQKSYGHVQIPSLLVPPCSDD